MYKVRIENDENGELLELECRGYLLGVVNDIDDEDGDYEISIQKVNFIDINNIIDMVDEALDEVFPPLNNRCNCENNCELNCDDDCILNGK